jgi:hypothetical protein
LHFEVEFAICHLEEVEPPANSLFLRWKMRNEK